MGKATVYEHNGLDIIAPDRASGHYNAIGFREEDLLCELRREVLEIGAYRFEPGKMYDRFGSNKKTSAGYVCYDGIALEFVGTWRDYALFSWMNDEHPLDKFLQEYEAWFWCWQFSLDSALFITVNHSRAGRIMEMNALPTGPKRWKP